MSLFTGNNNLKAEIKAINSSGGISIYLEKLPTHLYRYAAERISRVLQKKINLIIADTPADLVEILEVVKGRNSLEIKIGGNVESSTIAGLGYERVRRVWGPGEFSMYGDVTIIWPKGFTRPVRISSFDTEVEEISIINPETRKSEEKVSTLLLKELSAPDSEINYEVLIAGESFSEELPVYFYAVRASNDIEREIFIPHYDLGLREVPLIDQGVINPKVLENIARRYVSDGYKIKLVAEDKHQYEDVKGYLKNMGEVTVIAEDISLLSKGFADLHNSYLILTPFEVLGEINLADTDITHEENRPVDLAAKDIYMRREEAFKKIQPGDYIVHEDHGVGRYTGLAERYEGVYLELQYTGKDKLFVPVKQARKITKYIGSGSAPKLTPLNSGVWRRVKKKATDDAEKLAKELLQIYAVRKLAATEDGVDHIPYEEMDRFIEAFEFDDTEDQVVASEEVIRDLQSGMPMDRLLVGDVGFGKTEIAMRAMYGAKLLGVQVAFLAPTTILVEQHKSVLEKRFSKFNVKIGSVSRYFSTAETNKVLEALKKGEIDIIVGTHALLSKNVSFKKLGLIVIDEEQKFGVKQKEVLKKSRLDAHVLTMTATPIPRTLNMSLSGIKDISMITTPPPGRKPVKNYFEKFDWSFVTKAIKKEIDRKGQVYFVHNRVKNIKEYTEKLQNYFPDIRVEYAHGQMSPKDLSHVMYEFGKGSVQVLVCTTIIENGIDLPNVNTLIINNSDMFGLSQLYQIRGRIGRSNKQGYAHFMYRDLRGDAGARLDAISESESLGSGFHLSTKDMEIRGAGDLLGRDQSGAISTVGYGMFITLLEEKVTELKESLP